jgi:hypothetical protein
MIVRRQVCLITAATTVNVRIAPIIVLHQPITAKKLTSLSALSLKLYVSMRSRILTPRHIRLEETMAQKPSGQLLLNLSPSRLDVLSMLVHTLTFLGRILIQRLYHRQDHLLLGVLIQIPHQLDQLSTLGSVKI